MSGAASTPPDDRLLGTTRELARFSALLEAEALPSEVAHHAKRCLIDHIGVTLAGSADPSVAVVLRVAEEVGSLPHATVFGKGRRLSLPFTALVNGFSAHVDDNDDTYNPGTTTVHGNAPVWPVVLALGEHRGVDGPRALGAFVAGLETEIRVALAAGPEHYEAGWHVTGTVGRFGAAAAAGNLMELSSEQIVNAFGAAGTQAGGLKEVYGSMGKALNPASAAMDGMLSALLARAGFIATPTILEGRTGFLNVLSAAPRPERVTDGLGQRWELLGGGFKPYPCASLTHPTIEAVLALKQEHDLDPQDVRSIEARVHSYVSWVTSKPAPQTGLEGKFSIFHAAAVALVDGKAGMSQFGDERVRDPEVAAVGGRVQVLSDDTLAKDAAEVTITLTDGRKLTKRVDHNKGTPGNPMSDGEIQQKFMDLAAPLLGEAGARWVLDACWELESVPDVGEIARRCGG